jgi:acetyl-CoA decarbonylase/synthase complex subunit gamma
LGAPGISAHQVRKLSGFRVVYGPIRARDLPAFLDAELKATPEMRRKTFEMSERLELIPVELVSALKTAAILIPVLFLVSGLSGLCDFWSSAWELGSFSAEALLGAILAGAVLTPILLPWLPGRAFSLKGLPPGVAFALALAASRAFEPAPWPSPLELMAWLLLIPAVSSYLAMNFTGASTYTSLSGVRKEMRWALPLQIAASFIGLSFWLAARFMT